MMVMTVVMVPLKRDSVHTEASGKVCSNADVFTLTSPTSEGHNSAVPKHDPVAAYSVCGK